MAYVYECHLPKNSASLFAHIQGMQIKAILREELLVVKKHAKQFSYPIIPLLLLLCLKT
jgi:hypothetical protein